MVAPIHLDRPFDYLVPNQLDDQVRPGCRVRLRFAGRLVDGFVLSREPGSDHAGRLRSIERVSGPAVVTPEVLTLCRAVADRYCGTLAEVLRTAVPPRHVRTERTFLAALGAESALGGQGPASLGSRAATPTENTADAPADACAEPGAFPWEEYPRSQALLRRLKQGDVPTRVALTIAVGHDPVRAIVELVTAGTRQGTALVVVPDGRAVAEVTAELRRHLPFDSVGQLTADLGPSARYRAFLRIRHGVDRVVVGTRSAVFAPLERIAVAVLWDDGDDGLAEPHHPGWHAREVLAMRSQQQGFPLVFAGFARTPEIARMVGSGYLQSVEVERRVARHSGPLVTAAGQGETPDRRQRIPGAAFRVLRSGLERGPVLIQVPRAGYVPAVACAGCRAHARCVDCGGPLRLDASNRIACRWCSGPRDGFRCPECDSTRLRSMVIGAGRTAEEIGRAFPGVPVIQSGSAPGVKTEVARTPALVVATVGAEPNADGGYSAAVLLDGDLMLARADFRAEEETVRRWLRVMALVRDRADGGAVVICADPSARAVQAVIRADPVGWSERELAEREQARIPPAVAVATITGPAVGAGELAAEVGRALGVHPLGPRDVRSGATTDQPELVRYLLITDKRLAAGLSRELRSRLIMRSAAGRLTTVVRIDPLDLL